MAKETLRLKSKDVAHILNCCPDDVVYWARKGKLKGVKQGRYWYFSLKDIRAYKRKNFSKDDIKGSA